MKVPFRDYHILEFLSLFEGSSKPLDLALSDYLKNHRSIGAHDRRMIGETLYGMVRWKSLIDYFCPSGDPLSRLSRYRSLSFELCLNDPSIPEPARLGVNEFLYGRLKDAYGIDQARSICRVLNTPAPTTVRANLIKTTREELLKIFQEKFEAFPCKDAEAGIQLKKREPLFSLPEFKAGFFEVQDEGSQRVASLVQAKPGDLIVDYCSGSGGKTLAFAPQMKGRGQIYLHDVRVRALQEARQRLKRAGIQNAQCLEPGHPQFKALAQKCDWVLADVPCSGTGTLRRNPDAKWKIDGAMLDRLTALQREIVKEALQFLKPGGRLVYATCSLLPEENQRQAEYFLAAHSLEMIGDPLFLLPEEGGADGFFAAVFKKKKGSDTINTTLPPAEHA